MTVSDHTPPRRSIAAKVLELKSLVEVSRWALLDVVVMLGDLYDQVVLAEQRATPSSRSDLDPEPNHEDYIPEGNEG